MATAAYRDSIQSTLNKIQQPLKCLIKVQIYLLLFRLKFFNQATCMLILYLLCQGDKRNRESTDIVAVASM